MKCTFCYLQLFVCFATFCLSIPFSVLVLFILCIAVLSTCPEDAYRIDVEVDKECVGLDILDTAGQVRSGTQMRERERESQRERVRDKERGED